MEPGVLHWVVQRSAQTGAPITFRSFADFADALRHKAELERDEDGHICETTIETLTIPQSPK